MWSLKNVSFWTDEKTIKIYINKYMYIGTEHFPPRKSYSSFKSRKTSDFK